MDKTIPSFHKLNRHEPSQLGLRRRSPWSRSRPGPRPRSAEEEHRQEGQLVGTESLQVANHIASAQPDPAAKRRVALERCPVHVGPPNQPGRLVAASERCRCAFRDSGFRRSKSRAPEFWGLVGETRRNLRARENASPAHVFFVKSYQHQSTKHLQG